MKQKKIVLLIADKDYQPIEYGVTKEILSENPSLEILTACNKPGKAVATDSSTTQVDLTINQLNPHDIDGLFIIGGSGALEALDIPAVHTLLQEMMALNKLYGSICIASRILAKAGVLGGKRATGWDGDNNLSDIFLEHAVTYTKEPVTTDGLVVTATGPQAAEKFAQSINKIVSTQS